MGDEWVEISLGDVLTLQRGFDLPKHEREDGPFPVIASTGQVGTHSEYKVKAPGVVIGRSGSLGGGQYVQTPFWPLNTTLWVKDFKGNDPRFCFFLLKSINFNQFNAGSGVPTLNRNHIHSLPVSIPKDVNEQRAIAHILGTLDDKIELNRQMNETLEAMAQAIFKSWFVDFDPVVVNAIKAGNPIPDKFAERAAHYRANPGSLGLPDHILSLFPDRFADSDLGPIPEGWEVRPIGETASIVGGSTPSTKDSKYWKCGTNPFLTPRDMASLSGPIIFDTERYITDVGVEKISSKQLPIGTVLLSSRAPIGYLAINNVPLSVNQGIIAIICDREVSNYYIYFWIKTYMKRIKAEAGGTTFAEISKRTFRSIPILRPKQVIMNQFSKHIEAFYGEVINNLMAELALTKIRDGLLPRLITGELPVPDVEILLEEEA